MEMNHGSLIIGYVSWIGQYAEKNAVLVDILIECGAVPFVRTNIPQTLMVSALLRRVLVMVKSISSGQRPSIMSLVGRLTHTTAP